jgi:PAS domain S-box-containing protein
MKYLLAFLFLSCVILANAESQPDTRSGLSSANKEVSDSIRIQSYLEKANRYIYIDYDTALIYADSAVQMTNARENAYQLMSALRKKGQVLLFQRENDLARACFMQARERCPDSCDQAALSDLNYLIGLSYFNQGNNNDAMNYYRLALKQAESAGNNYRMSLSNTAIGVIYSKSGQQEQAIKYFLRAAELIDNDNLNQKASIYNNIGNIYLNQRQYRKALDYLHRARQFIDSTNDEYNKTKIILSLASAYDGLGADEKALKAMKEAEEVALRTKDKHLLARVYSHLAFYYKDQELLDTAIMYLNMVLPIYEEGKDIDIDGLIESYQNLADIYIKQSKNNKSKLNEAIKYAHEAYTLADSIGYLNMQSRAVQSLREAYKLKGDFPKALYYAEQYAVLSDSLFNRDKLQIVNDIEAKYSNAKNKTVIDQLKEEKQVETETLIKEKNKYYFLMIAFIVIFFLAVFFLISLVQNKRMQKELEKERKALKENQEELDALNSKLNEYYLESVRQSIEIATKGKTITAQLRIIEEKNRQFDAAINNLEDVYFRTNNRFEYTFVSPSILKYLQLSSFNQIIGKPLIEYWDTDKSTAKKLIRQIHKEGAIHSYAITYKTFKGELRYATVSATKIEKEGKFAGIEGIIHDVTESYINNKRIKDLHVQKEILLNNLPSLIFFKDVSLRYIEVNKNFANRLGYSMDEIIGKRDIELLSLDLAKEYEALDKKIIETKVPAYDVIGSQVCKDGKEHWYSTTKVPFIDSENNVKGIIGVVRDITSRVEYERNLLESKERIESAHLKMIDNINYARTIQNALMTSEERVQECINDFFVFYQSKDHVSGDFYYIKKIRDHLIFAAADCTGHGVSGAFLTMMGITFLHDISNMQEINTAAQVLETLRTKVKDTFASFGSENHNGLDIAYCAVNLKTKRLQYAGAYNPLIIVRNGNLIEYKATRNPIGYYPKETPFKNHVVQLQAGDILYLFSDGYVDQIGGPNKKKLKAKRFKNLLLEIHSLPLAQQKSYLIEFLDNWRGDEEQTDDIVIMGIRI